MPSCNTVVGAWFIYKYRGRTAIFGGHFAVAKNLRKQGVPLDIALLILFGRIKHKT